MFHRFGSKSVAQCSTALHSRHPLLLCSNSKNTTLPSSFSLSLYLSADVLVSRVGSQTEKRGGVERGGGDHLPSTACHSSIALSIYSPRLAFATSQQLKSSATALILCVCLSVCLSVCMSECVRCRSRHTVQREEPYIYDYRGVGGDAGSNPRPRLCSCRSHGLLERQAVLAEGQASRE